MKMTNLNMYQRLRDFRVPAVVLDEIFSNKDDIATLGKSWDELTSRGMNGDEIAEEMANIILGELGENFIQSLSVLDEK